MKGSKILKVHNFWPIFRANPTHIIPYDMYDSYHMNHMAENDPKIGDSHIGNHGSHCEPHSTNLSENCPS